MRLKSRTKFPPHGFSLLIPEIGMKKPFSGSFNEVVDRFASIVAKNPTLAQKNNWPTNRQAQEDWIDEREAKRMVAHSWFNFVDLEGESDGIKKKTMAYQSLGRKGMFQSVGAAVDKVRTALSMYHQMFGVDGNVVPVPEAERRAAICLVCPQHDTTGGLQKYFVKEGANELMALFSMLKDKDVKTSVDDKLGICQVCSCAMRAKVFVTSPIIKKNMPLDEISKLPPNCWIPFAVATA